MRVGQKKAFDCLEFKRRAQAELAERLKGLSRHEMRDELRRLADQGPLGSWWRRVRGAGATRQGSRRTQGPV